MAIKELQTRIALKYDSYANWTNDTVEGQGANLVLLPGEIGICAIENKDQGAQTAPTVLFKVGDGTTPFKSLKWASALAADVYSWAKASDVVLDGKVIKFVGTDKTITLEYLTEAEVDAKVKVVFDGLSALTARVAVVEGKFSGDTSVEGQIAGLDARLDVIEGEGEGSVKKALADAKLYADGLAGNYDEKGSAAQALIDAKAYADGKDGAIAEAKKAGTDAASALSAYKSEMTTTLEGKQDVIPANTYDVYGSASQALQDAKDYADGLAGNYEAAGAAAQALVDAKAYTDVEVKKASDAASGVAANLSEHVGASNPHNITKTTIGLENVDNKSVETIKSEFTGSVADGNTGFVTGDAVYDAIEAAKTTAAEVAQGKVDTLANGTVKANTTNISKNAGEISRVEGLVTAEVTRATGVEEDFEERISAMELFWDATADKDDVVNTLKEIQDYIVSDESGASTMLGSIQANADAIEALAERVDAAEDDIIGVEADISSANDRIDEVEERVGTLETLTGENGTLRTLIGEAKDQADKGVQDAADVKTYVDGTFKTDIQGYADGKASAAQTAAEQTAASALSSAVQTLNAKDAELQGNIDKKLDESDFTAHTTGHAKSATEITAEIEAAVKVETDARVEAVNGINTKIGTIDGTVASAIAGVKSTAEGAVADLAKLEDRVGTAEGKITTIEGIVNGDNSNDKLRSAITSLQELTGDASKGNAQLRSELTALQGVVNHETTGLGATKAIADQNKTDIGTLNGKVAAIEKREEHYLEDTDVFIFNCGTSTTVTHQQQ